MKIVLRLIGFAGLFLFGSVFLITFSTPWLIEDAGKDFIKSKIQEKTRDKIEAIKSTHSSNALLKFASKVAKNNEEKIAKLKEKLNSKVQAKLTVVYDEMRGLDFESRKKFQNTFKKSIQVSILSLKNANKRLLSFMKKKYIEVVTKLKTDLRIFTGSNTIVFLLLLVISFFKPKAATHLYIPAALLVLSTMICSYYYIFQQNWFFTIIYDSYLGWSYLVYLGVIFLFLCDIVLNKGKVTTNVVNAILDVLGSTISVTRC